MYENQQIRVPFKVQNQVRGFDTIFDPFIFETNILLLTFQKDCVQYNRSQLKEDAI